MTRDAPPRQVSTRQSSALEYPGDASSETQLLQAMTGAGWTRADELAVRSSLRLIRRTIVQRRYPAAPVSSLFLFARKQDLAFEQEVPGRPSQQSLHHCGAIGSVQLPHLGAVASRNGR
ncbi:MAG: LssY C-terminal domain-containing protein [Nocardioidaceae bacterium]